MGNRISIIMESRSQNEAFARLAAAAFVSPLDPTLSELAEIKTAVSEAVTNAIIHGYGHPNGRVYIDLSLEERAFTVEVRDEGSGIEDIARAREPLFTSKPELDRSGMGFTIMEEFMDGLEVYSERGVGTRVVMRKNISAAGNAGGR